MSAWVRITQSAIGLTLLVVPVAPVSASRSAMPSRVMDDANACMVHAPEAARRSHLPINVILRVMHAESRGRSRALSRAGAMGCMQIMPGTWRDLTRRYRLGDNPWDSRMNMIGGALYLAEMVALFGYPGAYSAYNAGPARYRRHVRSGVPLPSETIAYTAQLAGPLRTSERGVPTGSTSVAPRWQEAALFMPSPASRGEPFAAKAGDKNPDSDSPTATVPHALFPLLAVHAETLTASDGRPAHD